MIFPAGGGQRRIRVAILCETYAENMGYAITCIPAALAKTGDVEVHYITAGLPVYHHLDIFDKTYANFQNSTCRTGSVEHNNGYTLHYMDYNRTYGGIRLKALKEKLLELRPDIVQTFAHVSWASLDAALLKPRIGFKLFTGNHTTASVYPLAQRKTHPWDVERLKELLKRGLPGSFISRRAELCYGATADCSDVARRFFGVESAKVKTVPLGVDTDIFHPAKNGGERAAARALRQSLGVDDAEVLCAYTGRFAEDKNPLLLAQAVAELRKAGRRFRAVFFGEGVQREAIDAVEGAVVRPFVHYSKLGDLYRAADIGVWPTQESTSMIDAAASGTPIIVNDTIAAVERVEGNGLTYRLNDMEDLKRALLDLEQPEARRLLGDAGAAKMKARFSWEALVRVRITDYENALAAGKHS